MTHGLSRCMASLLILHSFLQMLKLKRDLTRRLMASVWAPRLRWSLLR